MCPPINLSIPFSPHFLPSPVTTMLFLTSAGKWDHADFHFEVLICDVQHPELSCPLLGMWSIEPLGNPAVYIKTKLRHILWPHDPKFHRHRKENKDKRIFTRMFLAALFIITWNWTLTKCSLKMKGMNKFWLVNNAIL